MDRTTGPPRKDCPLCGELLTTVLAESRFWRTALNVNQQLLGQSIIVLRRHEESVVALTSDEWIDLRTEVVRTTGALTRVFQPDHYNYAFLQNQDRHVHLHVFPRYATSRRIGGEEFTDPDYPDHYRVPSPSRNVTPQVMGLTEAALASALLR